MAPSCTATQGVISSVPSTSWRGICCGSTSALSRYGRLRVTPLRGRAPGRWSCGEGGALEEQSSTLQLPPVGAEVFDYLRPDARLPLGETYVYRTRMPPGVNA